MFDKRHVLFWYLTLNNFSRVTSFSFIAVSLIYFYISLSGSLLFSHTILWFFCLGFLRDRVHGHVVEQVVRILQQ